VIRPWDEAIRDLYEENSYDQLERRASRDAMQVKRCFSLGKGRSNQWLDAAAIATAMTKAGWIDAATSHASSVPIHADLA